MPIVSPCARSFSLLPVSAHTTPVFSPVILNEIRASARKNPTSVSLQYMFNFGANPTPDTLLTGARFLHKELPIRLARRAAELESLPYGLSQCPSVQRVRSWYITSYVELQKFVDIRTVEDELAFTDALRAILKRHEHVVPGIAQGIIELKRSRPEFASSVDDLIDSSPYLTDFLDRFYMARVGIRMLIGQHIALHQPKDGYVGIIDKACSPQRVILDAVADAGAICERVYGHQPEVKILGNVDLRFRYVSEHMYYMMFELLKNSMRASAEHKSSHPIEVGMKREHTRMIARLQD